VKDGTSEVKHSSQLLQDRKTSQLPSQEGVIQLEHGGIDSQLFGTDECTRWNLSTI